ncbi:hypothetical protein [Paenibacillus aquistagni]|uniref:hypothetical protein n=1 Tax=Paenibacillus aquistagni TaxID=1852522 RepID=UPI00145AC047|nr:hypothetical protein [Paenibacillus aquistagni]NMM52135.1 hypothetical protein [Paenibacillus aquistagni]
MSKVKARTHWVWTKLAEETFDARYTKDKQRKAGEPISDNPREVESAWLLRGYVIDAEDYIPSNGQLDLFDLLKV